MAWWWRGVGAVANSALTGLEYRDVITLGVQTSYLISQHTLISKPPDGGQALLECMKACLAAPGCVTFIMYSSQNLCYLSRHDRCANPTHSLISVPGLITYEVKAADAPDAGTTCLASCRASASCHTCGRPNCKGELCEECSTSCWTLEPLVVGTVSIVFSLTAAPLPATCQNEWQLVWSGGTTAPLFPDHTTATFRMLVVLTYTDMTRQAEFSGAKFSGTYLTVQTFVTGDAGNGWFAPFVSRQNIYTEESNLYAFFYVPGTLIAWGVESYVEQVARNATPITRGYYWYHVDPIIATTRITHISLWISP
ncbi:uncharacterized protein LOC135112135 [Scylla paramamosain]|uniref:uncharacterized protein LOC135112135 n=1 Tax=Scylla paramamosain TaxID=85552 RepID=UPI003083AA16